MEFFNNLANATFDFAAIGAWFSELWTNLLAHADILSLTTVLDGYVAMLPAAATAGILLALALIVAFFGKKLLGVMKFLLCFVAGYALGVYYLAAPVQSIFEAIPSWAVGLAVGVVAALLCSLVYFLAYVLAAGGSVYLILMGGYYLPEELVTVVKGNMVIALAGAAVAILIVLLLRKWIEMLGTAALGGWLTYVTVNKLLVALMGYGFDGIEFLAPYVTYVELGFLAVIGLIGFIVQIKTRRRY